MAGKFVKMRTLSASPARIMQPDHIYKLPVEEADELIAAGCAVEPTAEELRKKKVDKIPSQPDPEDVEPEVEDDDTDDEKSEQ